MLQEFIVVAGIVDKAHVATSELDVYVWESFNFWL